MAIIRHKELKPRSEYKRNYHENGSLKDIDVFLPDIDELAGKKKVWEIIKWLNEKNNHARFDIVVSVIGTVVAKQVLTNEEKKLVTKEKTLLSWKTNDNIGRHVGKWYEHFKAEGLIEYDIAPCSKTFVKGNYQRKYNTLEVTAKLTLREKMLSTISDIDKP